VVEDGQEYHFEDIRRGTVLPPCFKDYETGFAVLRISLVMQTLTALERTGLAPGAEVFTEGGFRKNEAYNALVSAGLKNNRVFLTDIAEATALGAAMTAKMALTGKSLADLANDFEVEYKEVAKSEIPELFPYRTAWLTHTG
jgi:sugar (pentulose or hexulose) kinase